MHPRRLLVAALVLLGLLAVPGHAAAPGLQETARTQLSGRLLELTMTTPALGKPVKVRVLLPPGYRTSTERYPVLYLLNGGGGSYLDWTAQGDAERITAKAKVLVVMPDGGQGGNYTNWYGKDGNGFTPQWETFHISQLLPWVDAHFRTIARRDQRIVAGLSMGGNGALHYAARHPDLFAGVASFSGANDTLNPVFRPITETTEISNGALPGSVFGPSLTQELRWREFNPVDLADNLRGLWVSLSFGNGQPGGPDGNGSDVIEQAVYDANVALHARLVQSKVPHVYNSYGPGAHNWFYWSRDLRQNLPLVLQVFAQHRTIPTTVTHWAADPSYRAYGWRVSTTRPVREISRLVNACSRGFALRGTGTAVVTTPPSYQPGRVITVRTTDVHGTRTHTVRVGSDRRIRVAVDLGAPNSFQQYTAGAKLAGTVVREAHVVIS